MCEFQTRNPFLSPLDPLPLSVDEAAAASSGDRNPCIPRPADLGTGTPGFPGGLIVGQEPLVPPEGSSWDIPRWAYLFWDRNPWFPRWAHPGTGTPGSTRARAMDATDVTMSADTIMDEPLLRQDIAQESPRYPLGQQPRQPLGCKCILISTRSGDLVVEWMLVGPTSLDRP